MPPFESIARKIEQGEVIDAISSAENVLQKLTELNLKKDNGSIRSFESATSAQIKIDKALRERFRPEIDAIDELAKTTTYRFSAMQQAAKDQLIAKAKAFDTAAQHASEAIESQGHGSQPVVDAIKAPADDTSLTGQINAGVKAIDDRAHPQAVDPNKDF